MKHITELPLRDAIAVRLRALKTVTAATDKQLAAYMGIGRTSFSNAIGMNRKDRFKPKEEAIVQLCNRSGLTTDFIYRGLYAGVPYELAIALQAALAGTWDKKSAPIALREPIDFSIK